MSLLICSLGYLFWSVDGPPEVGAPFDRAALEPPAPVVQHFDGERAVARRQVPAFRPRLLFRIFIIFVFRRFVFSLWVRASKPVMVMIMVRVCPERLVMTMIGVCWNKLACWRGAGSVAALLAHRLDELAQTAQILDFALDQLVHVVALPHCYCFLRKKPLHFASDNAMKDGCCFTFRRPKSEPEILASEHVNFQPPMGTYLSRAEPPTDRDALVSPAPPPEPTFHVDSDLVDNERTPDHPPAMYRLSYGRLSLPMNDVLDPEPEPVVIKQFVKNRTDRDFRQEFMLVHNVLGPHPNIVRYFDFHCNFRMLFMPRYHCSLYDVFRGSDDLDDLRALRNVFLQMATALAFCHSRLVAHRDVKIENFLVERLATDTGPSIYDPSTTLIKLCDFEFAMQCASFDTKVDNHCGSVFYASPELLSPHDYSPFTSDVWALGVSLFVLSFNRYPFEHDNRADDNVVRLVAKQIVHTNVHVPPHSCSLLRQLLCQMLSRNPLRRPTAAQLLVCPFVVDQ